VLYELVQRTIVSLGIGGIAALIAAGVLVTVDYLAAKIHLVGIAIGVGIGVAIIAWAVDAITERVPPPAE
jgi:hypothetical protein